ncbi:unnamed protein product [Rotaria sp. Silwood1]|nr:unnamed protein product [Rotaria sp. Silwood1]
MDKMCRNDYFIFDGDKIPGISLQLTSNSKYKPNFNCTVKFRTAQPSQRLIITIEIMDITDCPGDSLRIYDGTTLLNKDSKQQCGSATSFTFTSSTTQVSMIFISNSAVESSGFQAAMALHFPMIASCPQSLGLFQSPVCSLQWNTVGTTVAGAANGVAGVTLNRLNRPRDVFLNSDNTLTIADTANNRVQKWTIGAASGVTVAGQANGAVGNGLSQLSSPTGVIVDETSTVLVVDDINDRVQSWPFTAVQGTTVAGAGGNGAGNNQFRRPFGIARNANTRTLYISDSLNHRVMRYLAGAAVGAVIAGGAGAGNANNQLNFPTGIYFDQTSNSLIIANRNNHNIVRWVIGAATRTVLAGSAAGAPGGTAALLRNPDGVTLDSAKNLYVADTGNNRIQLFKVGQTNGITIAGVPGLPNANPSSLRSPSAVKVDSQGNLYVADTINNRIQKFTCNQS